MKLFLLLIKTESNIFCEYLHFAKDMVERFIALLFFVEDNS